ncbi:hypothetical protein LBO01_16170 [Companilactobacillus paralimentarius]|nr:hypothetical protein LBO01_16170 [Companilactobacillus paralimentarius]
MYCKDGFKFYKLSETEVSIDFREGAAIFLINLKLLSIKDIDNNNGKGLQG